MGIAKMCYALDSRATGPSECQRSPKRRGVGRVEAVSVHDDLRRGLILMLPRLKRFAEVLVGEKQAGAALLRRTLLRILAEEHRYQRGTALDRFAFAEIYRQWLQELGEQDAPVLADRLDRADFASLLHQDEASPVDDETIDFLIQLSPPHRLALLLVYGEGFDYEDAGRVLEISEGAVAARLIRASASLADRLGLSNEPQASASIATLHPRETTV